MFFFLGEKTGFVQVGPKKWFFPSGYQREAHNYFNFAARSDDIFVSTFPRSGTTWMTELVWLLANDLNYQKAAEISLWQRFPFLEFSCFVHKETKAKFLHENRDDFEKYQMVDILDYPAWKFLSDSPGKRFIKTHLPFSLLPPNLLDVGCKVIYVARNPRDVAVSFYHLNRLYRTQGYEGDFPEFWDYFQRNLVAWAPYWEHIKEGWNHRSNKNCLFLFYEDMNKDLRNIIEKVSQFIGKKFSDEQYDILEDHLRIDHFRDNQSVNSDDMKKLGVLMSNERGFIRSGKTGGWKNYFSEEMKIGADKWIRENLKTFDSEFPKELFY
nr:sulfotransferase 1C4-like [Leptinotarsa decemlineata]